MCCGHEEVEAHHVDYDRPLLVVWLCALHHNQIHHTGPGSDYRTRKRWTVTQDAFL